MEYAGLIIFFILLWIRPEYMFLLFYVVANSVLVTLLSFWSLSQLPTYAILVLAYNNLLISNAALIMIGVPFVALRKWLKTRKTGTDRKLDDEMETIRANIASREMKQ